MMNEWNVVKVHQDAGIACVQRSIVDSNGEKRVSTKWIEWTATSNVKETRSNTETITKLHGKVPPLSTNNNPSIAFNPAAFEHKNLQFQVIPSADGNAPQNLLILLHGRGDSDVPFTRFARQMALPQTACIALRAPFELPFGLGFTWYHDMDQEFNVIPPDQSHSARSQSLDDAARFLSSIMTTLHTLYGWKYERMFLFGFSQGATVAYHCARLHPAPRLGGIIVIAGGCLHGPHTHPYKTQATKSETPLLLIAGEQDQVYPTALAKQSMDQWTNTNCDFAGCQLQVIENKLHTMIQSQQEMMHVMRFFSTYLYLKHIELEKQSDIIEIT